ncbi:MAG: DUF2156 domain-containing protein [Gemmatimonadaceae bacterium]
MNRDDKRALALLEQFGYTATAFQTLAPGMRHWFDTNDDHDIGFVGFIDTGSAWVVAGEPVAARGDAIAVAERFVKHAHANRKRVAFFATEGALASSPRFRRVLIGEQPTWNPQDWSAVLSANRSMREQLRRARAKGVRTREIGVEEIDTEGANGKTSREMLNGIVRRWLATRPMTSMHFLVELEPFVHLESRRLFVAERNGVAIAFLSAAPVAARNGWLFEHLLRDPDAPNGSTELLVDCAMRTLSEQGVTWATLGLAPLAGEVSGWLRMTRIVARPFFNFRGLASFKGKLRPSNWEPIYLAYPRERSSVWAMRDGLRAFAGGSLLIFGARTVLRGPKPLLRALEYSLIPWTIALALWPAEPWFPKSHIKWAWVAFDVLLWSALYRLRKHWTQRVAIAIATMVSIDAVVTLVQAVTWNIARTRTLWEAAMVVVACSGPALAAAVLWGAVRRRASIS